MSSSGQQNGNNGQSMNQGFQGVFDSSHMRLSGTQYSSTILNHLLQQQSAAQRVEASLQQQKLLSSLLLSQANNSNLAAAVQQEFAASLGTPSLQMLPHLNRAGSQGLASGLLSRGDQDAMMRRLPGSSSQGMISSFNGQQQQQGDLMRNSERGDLEGQREASCTGVSSGETGGQETATHLPCQARGMAADHNSSTAYFEVPSNAKHGQHLLCSYPACRAAGVKFRYCLFCKKPVTKQNFRSRHLHAELDKPMESSGAASVVAAETTAPPAPKQNPVKKRPAVETEPPAKTIGFVAPAMVVPESFKVQPQRILDEDEEDASIICVPKTMMKPVATKAPGVDDALRKIMRRRRWNSLLSERPSGFQNMDAWMSDVISVSDTTKVFTPSASSFSDGGVGAKTSVDQLARWGALLADRPVSNADGAITNWLTKVLSISCPKLASKDAAETAAMASAGLSEGAAQNERREMGLQSSSKVPALSDFNRPVKRMKQTMFVGGVDQN